MRKSAAGMIFLKAPDRDVHADTHAVENTVKMVLDDVRLRGSAAVRDYTRQFDKSELSTFGVSPDDIATSVDGLDPQTRLDTVAPPAIPQSASEGLEGHRRAAAARKEAVLF